MNIQFTSLKTRLEYNLYLNMSTGYYEIESVNCLVDDGVVEWVESIQQYDSGHTLFQPSLKGAFGIIREFISR